MLILSQIDLACANLDLFDEYEEQVLKFLARYGACIEERLRSADGRTEIHLLYFPDADALKAYRTDPDRAALQDTWLRSGARSAVMEVKRIQ
jgi:hypothetical protein